MEGKIEELNIDLEILEDGDLREYLVELTAKVNEIIKIVNDLWIND